jgi:hypothetical protein
MHLIRIERQNMAETWDVERNTPNGEYVLHKEFEDGPDVFIAVNRLNRSFEVRISAASPAEESPDVVKGPFKALDEAIAAANAESKAWDARQMTHGKK